MVGAFIGGASTQYANFREAQGIAAGLRTEITTVAQLVRLRQYAELIDQIIARLQDPAYQPTANDFFSPDVTQEYFRVFLSTCGKIGLLGDSAPPTIRAFMLSQSVIEDFRSLRAERRQVEEGRRTPRREGLLNSTLELKGVLSAALASADEAVEALSRFEALSWFAWWRR